MIENKQPQDQISEENNPQNKPCQILSEFSNYQLPKFIKDYFEFLQHPNEDKLHPNELIPEPFKKAYMTLSQQQKDDFVESTRKFFKQKITVQRQSFRNLKKYQNEIILNSSCQLMNSFMGIPYWTSSQFHLDFSKREIRLTVQGKVMLIDLNQFLVRKAKKKENVIVFQPCCKSLMEGGKYKLFFEGNSFVEEIYGKLVDLMHDISNQTITSLLKLQKQEQHQENKFDKFDLDRQFPLNKLTIISYLEAKDRLLNLICMKEFQLQSIFQDPSSNTEIFRDVNNQKIYLSKSRYSLQAEDLKQSFLDSYYADKNKYRVNNEVIDIHNINYSLAKEKYMISLKVIENYIIRQKNENPNSGDILFVKQLDMANSSFLDFMRVQAIQLNKNQSELRILLLLVENQVTYPETAIKYLIEYSQMMKRIPYRRRQSNRISGRVMTQGPVTERGSEKRSRDSINRTLRQRKKSDMIEIQNEDVQKKYLIHRFEIIPHNNYKIVKLKAIPWVKDWKRHKDGGLICINKTLLDSQKQTCLDFGKTLGTKILTNPSSLLNTSLPVGIFKPQSQLQSLARIFSFAPILLQKAAQQETPFERIKIVTAFIISIGVMTITTAKSFNPIIGETYQAWIGGCPFYVQQITHHPPIMGYYFVGRKYKIHGSFQLKPDIVFDGANCQVESTSKIVFDDGLTYQFTFPKAYVHGVVLKDRQYNYGGKSYILQRRNSMLSVLNFGPRNRGFFSKNQQPKDFIYGQVYKAKESFCNKFNQKNPPSFNQKSDSVAELGKFQGIWHEEIQFGQQKLIHFGRQLPCALMQQVYPLPSNSTYRIDLVRFLQGDLKACQAAKQQMQLVQRNDRKLREKKPKNK